VARSAWANFKSHTFQIAWRSLAAIWELFIEYPDLPKRPDEVRSTSSEEHLRLVLAAVEAATTDLVIDLESPFVELGRQVPNSFRSTPKSRSGGG
jgi:hypothetical protein